MEHRYRTFRDSIELTNMIISAKEILEAVRRTNGKFQGISEASLEMQLNVFTVIDFRVLSGMMGEVFAGELARVTGKLIKNPSIDGYPDLLENSSPEMRAYLSQCANVDFLDYRFGGVEVKNTFGNKKNGSSILMGDTRIKHIKKKLDWKAHHQKTNHLLALSSDYMDGRPFVAAAFYSDQLTPDDWQKPQRPKEGSTMTSYSSILPSGCRKLYAGAILCVDREEYLRFFGLEGAKS